MVWHRHCTRNGDHIFGMFAVFFLVGRTEEFANMSWNERLVDPVDGMINPPIFMVSDNYLVVVRAVMVLIFVFQTAVVYWVLRYDCCLVHLP